MSKLPGKTFACAVVGLLAVGVVAAVVTTPSPVAAEGTSLEGSWSGGGTVRFPSGESERARCRANFRKRGGSSFSMTATCATTSAKIEQTASVERTGPNRYSGGFQNSEYNISGSINITVKGNTLAASLSGGGGSAHFSLGR